MNIHITGSLLAVIGMLAPACAEAQERLSDTGRREIESSCSACYGMTGEGNGPLKFFLTTLPADLTLLSRRNDGLFPVQRVMEVIDGRTGPTASPHGSREMPVWGKVYRDEASAAGDYPPEWAARVKLMALTDYLARIQER